MRSCLRCGVDFKARSAGRKRRKLCGVCSKLQETGHYDETPPAWPGVPQLNLHWPVDVRRGETYGRGSWDSPKSGSRA